jgi:hypothetical protein
VVLILDVREAVSQIVPRFDVELSNYLRYEVFLVPERLATQVGKTQILLGDLLVNNA